MIVDFSSPYIIGSAIIGNTPAIQSIYDVIRDFVGVGRMKSGS